MERSLQFHNSADSTTVMNALQHSSLYPDRLLANDSGEIWYVACWVKGRQVQRSSRSTNIQEAKRLRDQL